MKTKNHINQDIKNKLNTIENKNIKNFLKEAIEEEYKVQDQHKPRLGKTYEKLINKYYSD